MEMADDVTLISDNPPKAKKPKVKLVRRKPPLDAIPVDRLHHGDLRTDNFRFFTYQKRNGKYYELWLSPKAWVRYMKKRAAASRAHTRKLRAARKAAAEAAKKPS